jgi:hypothetical protein
MWTQKMGLPESLRLLRGLAKDVSKLGGPLSREIYDLVEKEDYQSVIRFKFDYTLPYTTDDFLYARQIQGFFKKFREIDIGVDKEAVAWEKFLASEEKCRMTNQLWRSGFAQAFRPDVQQVFNIAARKISQILGPVPSFDMLDFSYGPGANTSVKSALACARTKLSARLACSTELVPVAGHLMAEIPHITDLHASAISYDIFSDDLSERCTVSVDVEPGKLVFVPKDATTDRSIVVEPILNSFFQKGIGLWLKARLKQAGCDLYSQTRNQRQAFRGSISGHLATFDLASASDTVSSAVVWDLLPFEWAELLEFGRTGRVLYRGNVIELEKFSSMGNAYTFELESLLFYAISLACCEYLGIDTHEVAVYGDDIIVPTEVSTLLRWSLFLSGFDVNSEKSFCDGPFRESCGTDWLMGFDIRPFFVKERVSQRSIYVMHNWFIRRGEYQLARVVHSFVDPQPALYGPDGFGDGHLLGSYRLRLNRDQRRAKWGGGYFDTYTLKPVSYRRLLPGDHIVPVYSVYVRASVEGPFDSFRVRGSRGFARISVYTLATTVFCRVQYEKFYSKE